VTDLTPQQAIANVLHHTEDYGLNDAEAMGIADDVLHALKVAGYEVVEIRLTAQEKLNLHVRTAVKESGLKQVVIANRVGITAKHLSQMMTGAVDVGIDMGERILAELGRTLDVQMAARDGKETTRDR
jgi:predicted XRE-type DNA-binding protein